MLKKSFQAVRRQLDRAVMTDASPSVIVYTRAECHLCDVALETLQQFGITGKTVDIDTDPTLLAKYDTCVPVVEIDGKVRFRGRVDERLLRRLLKARS